MATGVDRLTHDSKLNEAYALCRAIAKREAKNFYYAFVALPRPRRDAICAIYAFMRQADDLADDESLPCEERRRRLDAWQADWRGVCHGGDSSDLVFFAVRDAVERYNIPLSLLDELIAGVTMDLDQPSNDCHPERSAAKSKDLRFKPLRLGRKYSILSAFIFEVRAMPREILWTDAEEIGIQLQEKYPELDPLTVRFTDLHRYVTELEGYADDPAKSNESRLEAIQMAWQEEFEDAQK